MKILILGADGYLGWPCLHYLRAHGHDTVGFDNFSKRIWEIECRAAPLWPIASQDLRRERGPIIYGDLTHYKRIRDILDETKPDAIVHFAEQASAPYSMQSVLAATDTQINNVKGTLNLLWAMREVCPNAHLVKLGTMGEYGTPNIDIEEGFIEITHKGRKDVLPFPKQPGSFYHLSKVHDSHNIAFVCRTWGLRATDLNQGVVYGLETDECPIENPIMRTSFHYDAVFGTVLNRFITQAACGEPLTVYGKGGQARGFIDIRDTMECVRLTLECPPIEGYRVFNQFAELASVYDLACLVADATKDWDHKATISQIDNPRKEAEEHYYNPANTLLLSLGYQPRYLESEFIDSALDKVSKMTRGIQSSVMQPKIKWE